MVETSSGELDFKQIEKKQLNPVPVVEISWENCPKAKKYTFFSMFIVFLFQLVLSQGESIYYE